MRRIRIDHVTRYSYATLRDWIAAICRAGQRVGGDHVAVAVHRHPEAIPPVTGACVGTCEPATETQVESASGNHRAAMGNEAPVGARRRIDRWGALILFLLWAPYGHPAGAAIEAALRLDQLAAQLGDAPEAVRADLARVVLSEMAAAYAAEAQRARRESRRSDADPDLRRWSAAVSQLSREIARLAESVTDATRVQITVNRDHSVTLLVDGQPVDTDGPRVGQQATLEARMMARFCALHSCDQFATRGTATPPPSQAGPLPLWRFSAQAGPVCSTGDGLEFRFATSEDLLRKRGVCKRVVAELNSLVVEIRNQHSGGTQLDWQALSIVTLPLGDRQRVSLNRAGDSFQANLPALAATPELLVQLRPWLIARVKELDPPQVAIDADRLLPPVGFLGQ